MGFRVLLIFSTAALHCSGCYFWDEPPLPADDSADTSEGAERQENEAETSSGSPVDTDSSGSSTDSQPSTADDTESETQRPDSGSQTFDTGGDSGDKETEDTGSDSETTDPKCTSGVCCDLSTNSFKTSGVACESGIDYRCDGSGCGAQAQERTVVQHCSGSSSDCDGSISEGSWVVRQSCGQGQICATDGSSYADCKDDFGCGCSASGNWHDPLTGLCWQEPADADLLTWLEAISHCENGTWGGYTDWELPDIDELISLIRLCVDGGATGDLSLSNCGVRDPGCLESTCNSGTDCEKCSFSAGPGNGGRYWMPELSSLGEDTRLWSSSALEDNWEYAWFVRFLDGGVYFFKKLDTYNVRCVRRGR